MIYITKTINGHEVKFTLDQKELPTPEQTKSLGEHVKKIEASPKLTDKVIPYNFRAERSVS